MKRIFIFLAAATIASPLWSKSINESIALEVANQVLLHSSATLRSGDDTQQKSLQLLYTSSSSNIDNENVDAALRSASANETVYFYVFGGENNEGFVIVSGDDRVVPVLGYSDTNGFSADDMPDNLKWWLGEYARQIQFAIDNDIAPTQEVQQQWTQYLGNNNDRKEEQK
ncbi:MAG: Spi family protease inhibitor [Candidatus Symbiothrix sp.]|jgi:hypothetical protein|nr:Spi family protease inhibitor [Candidatus Symbiothrix sp.]